MYRIIRWMTLTVALLAPSPGAGQLPPDSARPPSAPLDAATEAYLIDVIGEASRIRVATADYELELDPPRLEGSVLLLRGARALEGAPPPDARQLALGEVRRLRVHRPRGLLGAAIGAATGWVIARIAIDWQERDRVEQCLDPSPFVSCPPPLAPEHEKWLEIGTAAAMGGFGFYLGRTRFAWSVVFPRG